MREEALDQDLTKHSAADLAQEVGRRAVSAREVVESALARVEAVNPTLNAVCTLNDAALDEADAADRRLAGGAIPRLPRGGSDPRQGQHLHPRDPHDLRLEDPGARRPGGGFRLRRTAAGRGRDRARQDQHPRVRPRRQHLEPRLRDHPQPWDVNRTAGGSSGGTGAAVAAGLAPAGLGTDLGGSIRVPSSFNGLVGIRPAPGRVAFYPTEFGWDTLVAHVQGPMARTVEDVGILLSVLAGPDDRDPMSLPEQGLDFHTAASAGPARPSDLAGVRLALSIDLGGLVPVEPEVEALARGARATSRPSAARWRETFFDTSGLAEIIFGTRGFGMIARYAERYERHRDVMTRPLLNQIEAARDVDVEAVARAERLRTDYWHRVRALLERHDFILTPAVGAPPFRLDRPLPDEVGGRKVERFYDVFLTAYAFSVTGLPAMSIPAGSRARGCPSACRSSGRGCAKTPCSCSQPRSPPPTPNTTGPRRSTSRRRNPSPRLSQAPASSSADPDPGPRGRSRAKGRPLPPGPRPARPALAKPFPPHRGP